MDTMTDTTTKTIRVVQAEDAANDAELLKACGFEDDSYRENNDYFTGDVWFDCDRVKVDDVVMGWVEYEKEGTHYVVINFDASEYPDHVELIKQFLQAAPVHYVRRATWEVFYAAPSAIAYRGGMGYTFGIWASENRQQ